MRLSRAARSEISEKIATEGFDYYFAVHGADSQLKEIIGIQIDDYLHARKNLLLDLEFLGIDIKV